MIRSDYWQIAAQGKQTETVQAWWKRLYRQWRLWDQRKKQRRELLALSDAALKDIGISRYDAVQEGEKPFWQD